VGQVGLKVHGAVSLDVELNDSDPRLLAWSSGAHQRLNQQRDEHRGVLDLDPSFEALVIVDRLGRPFAGLYELIRFCLNDGRDPALDVVLGSQVGPQSVDGPHDAGPRLPSTRQAIKRIGALGMVPPAPVGLDRDCRLRLQLAPASNAVTGE